MANRQERFCPRCFVSSEGEIRKTVWSNETDEGLELACTECGLRNASPLTAEEHAAAVRRYERPGSPRQTWRFV